MRVSRDIPETGRETAPPGKHNNPRECVESSLHPFPEQGELWDSCPNPPVLLPGGSQVDPRPWNSLGKPKGAEHMGWEQRSGSCSTPGAVSFPGTVRMIPTHLLESELVGKSTFNVLILTGGVQVVGAHLGKHRAVREPGRAGKALMFQLHQSPRSCPGRSCPRESQLSTRDQLCCYGMFMEMLSSLP